jgi:hypothetical protein
LYPLTVILESILNVFETSILRLGFIGRSIFELMAMLNFYLV